MTPKDKRTIESDLMVLFSPRALVVPATIEEWKKVGFFHPSIRTETNTIPLTEEGIAALRRITSIMQKIPEIRDSCSRGEIAAEVHHSYENWIKQLLQPNGEEFVTGVVENLRATVKDHSYLVGVEGVRLNDFDQLELGPTTICNANPDLLRQLNLGGSLSLEALQKQFPGKVWLIGKSHGSPEVSRQRFEHQTALSIGILAVCGALLFRGAIWRSHVRALISPFRQGSVASVLRWEAGGANPSLSRSWGSETDLPLNAESIVYLRKECFLGTLTALLERKERSEVEEALVRSLYWFADAHADQNTTMCFIKLWSCVECFFAIADKDVTEANARGLATILTFAGYGLGKVEDYHRLKKRIKSLYNLRCRAIHRAKFDEVQLQDLEDLSQWIAWLIISMTALTERGYRTLHTIKDQAVRLDALSTRKL